MKKRFYTESAYVYGLIILALGTTLMEKANMGMSMVVAPAYLLHMKLAQFLPWFTFGVAEYTFQAALLLILTALLRQFRIGYLFSFVTAVLYGIMLDLTMLLTTPLPVNLPLRYVYFILGMLLGSLGVSMLFHTYIAPEVYELFVKEWSEKYHHPIGKCKTAYDCISCLLSIVMSFLFFGFGHFEGVKAGTILCALCNGCLVGKFSRLLENIFEFSDRFRTKTEI